MPRDQFMTSLFPKSDQNPLATKIPFISLDTRLKLVGGKWKSLILPRFGGGKQSLMAKNTIVMVCTN